MRRKSDEITEKQRKYVFDYIDLALNNLEVIWKVLQCEYDILPWYKKLYYRERDVMYGASEDEITLSDTWALYFAVSQQYLQNIKLLCLGCNKEYEMSSDDYLMVNYWADATVDRVRIGLIDE